MGTPEHKSAGGMPIATGALVLVMLGAYGVSTKMVAEARAESDEKLAVAAEYLMEKPYLDAHPTLEAFAGVEQIDKRRAQFWTERARQGALPIPSGLRQRRQQILDEKVDQATESLMGLPDRVWGLHASEPSGPSFLTHAFIHSRFLHLATSVLTFCWLGVLLERVWGSATLLGFALCAAAVSGGVFVLTNLDLDASLIGFSGVVAASLGAYVVNAGNTGRGASYFFTLACTGALLLMPALLGQEWSLTPISKSADFGPSQWSLLGGAIFGVVAVPVIWMATLHTSAAASGLSQRDIAAKRLLDRARKAALGDNKEKSATLFKQATQQNPTDRSVALEAWSVARTIGLEKKASGLMLTAIRDELRSGELEAAAEHWLELLEAAPDVRSEPRLMLRLAPLLHGLGRTDEATRTLECALRVADPASAAEVASNVALAARGFEPELARRAAQRALAFEYLDPEIRSSLERVLAQLPESGEPDRAKPVTPQSSQALCFDAAEVLEIAEPALDPSEGEWLSEPDSSTPERGQSDEMWDLDEISDEEIASQIVSFDDALSEGAERPRVEGPAGSTPDEFVLELPDEFEDLTDVLESDPWSATLANAPAAPNASPAPAAAIPPDPAFGAAMSSEPAIEMEVSIAVPTDITAHCLTVEMVGEGKRSIELDDIDAIATALVGGLGPTPILIIDLAFNWMAGGSEPLRILRLRSDQFNAKQLMDVERSEDDALREMMKHLLGVAGPVPLPDPMSVAGLPFAEFADVEEYERVVLSRQGGEELELL